MIIADDIRTEASGKLIVVGMYTNDIALPFEPFVVPQLYVLFTIEGDHPEHPDALTLRVTLPGEKEVTQYIPLTWPSPERALSPDDIRQRWTLKAPFPLGFCTLRPGGIRGSISVGAETVQLARFWIRLSAPPAPPPTT